MSEKNPQSVETFAAEQKVVEESAPPVVWRRPSDHDQDRLGDPLDPVVVSDVAPERLEVVGAGPRRGVILHKLMEELLTGELESEKVATVCRAGELLLQLQGGVDGGQVSPDPLEMAETALRALALPEIAALRSYLVPELAVWATAGDYLVAGRVDALAVKDEQVEMAIDWKSDVNPTPAVRSAYAGQLRDYLAATGAKRGALVFLSLGEVAWVERPVMSLEKSGGT